MGINGIFAKQFVVLIKVLEELSEISLIMGLFF